MTRNGSAPPASVAALGSATHASLPATLAPIALFVYGRPDHTRQTVEALRGNELAAGSDLFIFADGPKCEAAAGAVDEVRRFIRTVDGFKSVTIVERERNWGLSKSIVAGVSELCERFGRAIVVEDDIVTAPDFLTFINLGLQRYEREARVFSVGAFNLQMSVPQAYPYDVFFSYRFMCWGWGTWRDRWQKADWSVGDFAEFMASPERQRRFNRGGNDLCGMLARHMAGKIDSWDTVFAYTHSKHDALALLPVNSKTYNIGMDGSGIHCRRRTLPQTTLAGDTTSGYRFPDYVDVDRHFVAEVSRMWHRPLYRRVVRWALDVVGAR